MFDLFRCISVLVLVASSSFSFASALDARVAGRGRQSEAGPTISSASAVRGGMTIPVPPSAQIAVVVEEGGGLYQEPNFDAPILEYLPIGAKFLVSRAVFGQPVRFYKAKVGNKIGYVAVNEVRTQSQADAGSAGDAVAGGVDPGAKGRAAKDDEKLDIEEKNLKLAAEREAKIAARAKQPFALGRYVGFLFGNTRYREKITGVGATENVAVYGLRATGPDLFFDSPPFDFNLAFHFGAPSYYQDLSTSKPTGFLMVSDLLLMFPFFAETDAMGAFVLGPLVKYSSFKIQNTSGDVNADELNVGLSTGLSLGYRIGEFALRADVKWWIEELTQTVFQASLQKSF